MNNEKKDDKIIELSQQEIEEIREEAKRKAKETKHKWRQKGPWLVCKSCQYEHAIYIGTDKTMVGENEDGSPIFELKKT